MDRCKKTTDADGPQINEKFQIPLSQAPFPAVMAPLEASVLGAIAPWLGDTESVRPSLPKRTL
jgi:hypothetical protein